MSDYDPPFGALRTGGPGLPIRGGAAGPMPATSRRHGAPGWSSAAHRPSGRARRCPGLSPTRKPVVTDRHETVVVLPRNSR